MSESTHAQRTTIQIGNMEVEGFQMPDGSYTMSQTQAAEIVGQSERNARDFLQSRALKSLLGEGYTPAISEVDSGQTRIRALPLPVVNAYWLWQAYRGNKQAFALAYALSLETLERRFDAAFGVQVSDGEAERRQLIDTLMQSFATPKKRAPFGCMEGTGEILGDIVAPALDESAWEVLREATA